MTKQAASLQPIELDCADETVTLEMTRWLSHLRAERRLSPKTSEAYARDVRQCLTFLAEHWGKRVTRKAFAALEASDIRAFMAMRRADDIGIEDAPPGFRIGVDHPDEWPYRRCVNQAVDAAERIGSIIDGRSTRFLVGDIAFNGDRARARLRGGSLDACATSSEQRDLSATLREADTNATPKST